MQQNTSKQLQPQQQAEIMISCNLILASHACGWLLAFRISLTATLHLIMCEICDFMASDKKQGCCLNPNTKHEAVVMTGGCREEGYIRFLKEYVAGFL